MGNRGVVVFKPLETIQPEDFVVEFFWQANWDDIQEILDTIPEEVKPNEFVEGFAYRTWELFGGPRDWKNRNYNYKYNMTAALTTFNSSYLSNLDNGIYVVDPVARKIVDRTFIQNYNPTTNEIVHYRVEQLAHMDSVWENCTNQMRINRKKQVDQYEEE